MPVFLRWLLRLGPINPIAVRLVQGGSRRRRHFYIRTFYLGALILCLLWLLMSSSGKSLSVRDLARSASVAFEYVAYLQIVLICLLAPVFMAGAIAQEANPKTWDILLTTPLGAAEIVLGNLFGRLFFILALLFSSLPLFAMTQYFGGVPGPTIYTSYLIAGCAALLVGAMAIALSVSRMVGKRAVFAFYISVVTYLAITFAADRILGMGTGRVTWMTALNPFLALEALLDPTTYARYPEGTQTGVARWFLEHPVTTWCGLSGATSVLLMVASTFTVRAGGLARGGAATGGGGPAPWYRKMFGLAAKGADSRPARQVWSNPIAWREAAARNATLGKMMSRWSFIAIGGLWGLGVVLYYHGGNMSTDTFRGVLLATVLGEIGVVTLVAINMSATAVAREREDGTLDLLLTTPITPTAYLSGKVRGMVAYLIPLLAVPIGTLLLAGVYVALGLGGMIERSGGVTVPFTVPSSGAVMQMPAILPEAGLLAAVVAIPFAALCCMVGLKWSIQSKGSIGSVVSTVLVVGAIAGVIGFCGYQAGTGLEMVGPVVASTSPGSLVFATVIPESGLYGTVKNGNLDTARVGLVLGAFIAAGVSIAVVYGLRATLVHNFDMTVRKLAGQG